MAGCVRRSPAEVDRRLAVVGYHRPRLALHTDIRDRFQLVLERFLMRGPLYRLLFVVGIVVGVSVVGGLMVLGTGQFDDPLDAVWWAFLRLSDPGYLGDDEGVWTRVVSTGLTVAGYVLFLGAMIAIMTQWLNGALRRLEIGLTPVSNHDHFVIMGWTTRTATLVQELLMSDERVQLFLRLRGARMLNVVVMAEQVDGEVQQDLRERVGAAYRASSVILRSGSPLRLEHLRRVATLEASAILLPAPESGHAGAGPDTQTIKTLLSLSAFTQEHDTTRAPLVVAELLDARKMVTARRAYRGPLEIIASNRVISSLMCQTMRHPGLSHAFSGLLRHGDGSEIYARECPQFEGMRFGDLSGAFPAAVLLGVVRREHDADRSLLNPSDDLVVRADDRFVLVAEDFGATRPPARFHPASSDRGQGIPAAPALKAHRRILVLGWNHHVPDILGELDSYQVERFELVIAAMVPLDVRLRHLENHEVVCHRVAVEHHEIDYTVPGQLRRLDPASFDNVVLVANDWAETEEADARTILGHLLLREIIEDQPTPPHVLVELNDPGNLSLFQRGTSEVIIPPTILSHIMAQVALRRELRVVFDDLFGPEGSEVFFRPAAEYGLVGREVDFAEIHQAVARRNETALGLRLRGRGEAVDDEVLINPPRDRRWPLREGDDLVVLATYAC